MKSYDKKATGKLLKEMRESCNWNQSKMASELNALIGDALVLEGDTGKQRVSQFETGKGITLPLAFAYAEIFGVSLDYIFGRSEHAKPEYGTAKEVTRLSDKAIENLQGAVDEVKNDYIGHENFNNLLALMFQCVMMYVPDIVESEPSGDKDIEIYARRYALFKESEKIIDDVIARGVERNKQWCEKRYIEMEVENAKKN